MRTLQPERLFAPPLSRRRFVQGLAGSTVLLSSLRTLSFAAAHGDRTVLTGPDFDLTIEEVPVNYTGRSRTATAVNGQVPGPLLRMREGDAEIGRASCRERVEVGVVAVA